MKQVFPLIAALFLIACTSAAPTPTPTPVIPDPSADYSEAGQTLCAEAGGRYQREGRLGWWRCTLPYRDAGKICSDSSQCEGKCLASEAVREDWIMEKGDVRGSCQATDSPFGCSTEIKVGQRMATLCVD